MFVKPEAPRVMQKLGSKSPSSAPQSLWEEERFNLSPEMEANLEEAKEEPVIDDNNLHGMQLSLNQQQLQTDGESRDSNMLQDSFGERPHLVQEIKREMSRSPCKNIGSPQSSPRHSEKSESPDIRMSASGIRENTLHSFKPKSDPTLLQVSVHPNAEKLSSPSTQPSKKDQKPHDNVLTSCPKKPLPNLPKATENPPMTPAVSSQPASSMAPKTPKNKTTSSIITMNTPCRYFSSFPGSTAPSASQTVNVQPLSNTYLPATNMPSSRNVPFRPPLIPTAPRMQASLAQPMFYSQPWQGQWPAQWYMYDYQLQGYPHSWFMMQ